MLLLIVLLQNLIVIEYPYGLFLAAVIVSAWYGGMELGLLSTVLSAIATEYFFVPGKYSYSLNSSEPIWQLEIFLVEAVLISSLIGALNSAKRRSELREQRLRESEEQFRQITENMREIVWMCDPEMSQMLYVSPIYEEIWGRTCQSLYEQPSSFIDAIHPEDRSRIRAAFPKQIREEYNEEYRIVRPDGSIRWVRSRAFPIKNQVGQVYRLTGVIEDITDRKLAEEALRESEERYRCIVETAEEGIWIIDAENKTSFVNNKIAQMLGYSVSEMLGTSLFNYMDEEGKAIAAANVERRRQGIEEQHDFKFLRSDGSPLWAIVSTNPIFDATGQYQGALGMVTDITQRKQTEERLHFLAEASNQLVASFDDKTILTNLTQLAVPRIADCCVVDLVSDDGLQRVAVAHVDSTKLELLYELNRSYPLDLNQPGQMIEVLLTGKSVVVAEVTDSILINGSRDNEHLNMLRQLNLKSYIIVPLCARGRILGVISFVSVYSERRYGQEDLALAETLASRAALAVDNARLYRESQEANLMKDEFLAILSHELRSPLNAILGWAKLLRTRNFDSATTARALETIERNAQSQTKLIEDLLDISRLMRGKLSLQMRPVNLVGIIEAAHDTVLLTSQAKGVQLETVLDSAVGLISGDANRLQQVVWNLLTNAIKFTPQGGCVQVKLERVGSHALISVRDTGMGISPGFLPFVFDRFRQADSTTTRDQGGLGLGLAIVRQLVEMHSGTISALSEGEGKGATFIVELPLLAETHVKPPLASNDAKIPQDAILVPSLPSDTTGLLTGVRVLVVDDETDTLEFLTATIESYGAEVKAVASAFEALEVLERWQPDVLLSDIGMPGEDGYSLIRKIRALPSELARQIPAVALTAYAREEDRRQALEAGFQMHLAKPVDVAELVAVVANLVNQDLPL